MFNTIRVTAFAFAAAMFATAAVSQPRDAPAPGPDPLATLFQGEFRTDNVSLRVEGTSVRLLSSELPYWPRSLFGKIIARELRFERMLEQGRTGWVALYRGTCIYPEPNNQFRTESCIVSLTLGDMRDDGRYTKTVGDGGAWQGERREKLDGASAPQGAPSASAPRLPQPTADVSSRAPGGRSETASAASTPSSYDDQSEATARLNQNVLDRSDAIVQRNGEAQADYEQRRRAYREALARQQAEADRIRREDERRKREYEARLSAWRKAVEDCKRGVRAACAAQP